jgi:hypothetical protein
VPKPAQIEEMPDSEKERLQSHRTEYTNVALEWRFVTAARGLLALTESYSLTNVMNGIRLHYLQVKHVTMNEFAGKIIGSVQIVDDTIDRKVAFVIAVGILFLGTIVMIIDRQLNTLQLQ